MKDTRDRREYQKEYRKKRGTEINLHRKLQYKTDSEYREKRKRSTKKSYRRNRKKILARLKREDVRSRIRDRWRQRYHQSPEFRAYRRKWKNKFPERDKEYQRRTKLKLKVFVMQKYGGKCIGCGTDELAILSMDHINDDGHKERKTTGQRGYCYLRKGERRPDIQILCMGCQFRKRIYGPNIAEWKKKKQFLSDFPPVKIKKYKLR